jgi:hypothetical protein
MSWIPNTVDYTCLSLPFQDVALQMDAKLWGEEFNRHNPPKKVDIFMMAVMELVDRPGRPLYHVEHYIGGHCILQHLDYVHFVLQVRWTKIQNRWIIDIFLTHGHKYDT